MPATLPRTPAGPRQAPSLATRRQPRPRPVSRTRIGKLTPSAKETSNKQSPLTAQYVFEQYTPRIYNIVRRMLSQEVDAEDVLQDILVLVVRKLHTYRGEAEFTTWLHRVSVNAVLVHRRKQAPRLDRVLGAPLENVLEGNGYAPRSHQRSMLPEQAVLDRETQELIEQAISRLPEMYRDVFVLADIEELSNADIGDMLGLTLSAVKSRLHRARLYLREELAPYFRERCAG